MNKTVVFDFDGVIHSYSSGWQGGVQHSCPPVPGIESALKDIHESGYYVTVVSTRCSTSAGRTAIGDWLEMYGLDRYVDLICKEKPPAIVYIDDRAICFDGHPETLLGKIDSFEPWNKQTYVAADELDGTEIVRCKDCKHLYFKDFFAYCPYMVGACKPDGFCNHGEPRSVKRTCFTCKNYKGFETCGFSGMKVKISPDEGCSIWEKDADGPKGTE